MRLLALALLLANGLYFAWSNALLQPYGFAPAAQTEPHRLAQQIQPQAVRVLSPEEFRRVEDEVRQDQAPKECLQAGPLDAGLGESLRPILQKSLPAGSWALEEAEQGPRWIVYMGKYASAEALAKKRAEVLAMNLKPEALVNAALEPGFSLGSFELRAEAEKELARLTARGLHTARVAQERDAGVVYWLKLPAVPASQLPKLAEVRSALGSQSLQRCN